MASGAVPWFARPPRARHTVADVPDRPREPGAVSGALHPRRWRRRLSGARTALATALWPLPAISVVVAIGLAIGLRHADLSLHDAGGEPTTWLFGGDGSAARTLLSAIAGSLATIVALLFSLTIVTLQLASTQYSPRLLQTFSRDRVVQSCLGILLGTFVYSLVVLRNVRSSSDPSTAEPVPRLSITVAVALTLASVGALVAFIGHQVKELRVETMMRKVHTEAARTLERLERQAGSEAAGLPHVPPHACRVRARTNGFLQQVHGDALVAALAELRTVLLLERRPGEAIIAGTPIGWLWSEHAGEPADVDAAEAALDDALLVGFERVDREDPSYGLRKLTDIAVRALSPGVNDPTTAVHALSHISALLGDIGQAAPWDCRGTDRNGTPRLFRNGWDYGSLVDLALAQIVHYGHRDPAVADRLFGVLSELEWRVTNESQRAAVDRLRRTLVESCLREPPTGWDAEDVHRRAAPTRIATTAG